MHASRSPTTEVVRGFSPEEDGMRPDMTHGAAAVIAMSLLQAGCGASGGSVTAPSHLFYMAVTPTYLVGVAIEPNVLLMGQEGTTNFTASPALPPGLRLDAVTGVIDGTPTVTSPATPYVVTASGPAGSMTASLTIAVRAEGTFRPAASTALPRGGHTATLLGNGQVLVAGGASDPEVPDAWNPVTGAITPAPTAAELFDPGTGTWAPTPRMVAARWAHTATPLRDGRVLVTGGVGYEVEFFWTPIASTEIFDPASGTWSPAAPMNTPRYFHAAVALPDGKVLVSGGWSWVFSEVTVEIYDPAADAWTVAPGMHAARVGHTATLLPDGRVLVVGGLGDEGWPLAAELFDEASGVWSVSPGELGRPRASHSAVALPDGRVLIACGIDPSGAELSAPEFFIPATGSFQASPDGGASRAGPAVLLPDGTVLAAFGLEAVRSSRTADIFDPASGAWAQTDRPKAWRPAVPRATPLRDGRVLFTGGGVATSEVFSVP
jgi:hypothetical protein